MHPQRFDKITFETLDLYIARHTALPGQKPPAHPLVEYDPTQETVSYLEFAKRRIELLKGKTSYYQMLSKAFDFWTKDDVWVRSESGVTIVADSGSKLNAPKDCLPLQIAVQDNLQIFYDPRIFDRLDLVNQAALVLHEVLYKIALQAGHTTSREVQKFVGLMMRKDLETMTGEAINAEIERLRLIPASTLLIHGIPVTVMGELIPEAVKRYWVWKNDSKQKKQVEWSDGTGSSYTPMFYKTNDRENSWRRQLILFSNESWSSVQGIPLKANTHILLHENGILKKIVRSDNDPDIQGIPCYGNEDISFHSNGRLEQCMASKDFILNGTEIKNGTRLYFSETGQFFDSSNQKDPIQ